jgi:hypothetical protein
LILVKGVGVFSTARGATAQPPGAFATITSPDAILSGVFPVCGASRNPAFLAITSPS